MLDSGLRPSVQSQVTRSHRGHASRQSRVPGKILEEGSFLDSDKRSLQKSNWAQVSSTLNRISVLRDSAENNIWPAFRGHVLNAPSRLSPAMCLCPGRQAEGPGITQSRRSQRGPSPTASGVLPLALLALALLAFTHKRLRETQGTYTASASLLAIDRCWHQELVLQCYLIKSKQSPKLTLACQADTGEFWQSLGRAVVMGWRQQPPCTAASLWQNSSSLTIFA